MDPEYEVDLEAEVSLRSRIDFILQVEVGVYDRMLTASLGAGIGLGFEATAGLIVSDRFDHDPIPYVDKFDVLLFFLFHYLPLLFMESMKSLK